MSNNDSFKKTFFKKSIIFRFVQKLSKDCKLTKNVTTISNLNNSKNLKTPTRTIMRKTENHKLKKVL